MSASDYGPECVGSLTGAVSTSVFRTLIPFVGSFCSRAQIELGDKYRQDAQKLLDQYFDNFPEHSKKEIKEQMRRVDATKKRVDRSKWWIQKQATLYANLAEKLLTYTKDISEKGVTKAMFERNNMSYTSLDSFLIDSSNSNDIPLHSISVGTSGGAHSTPRQEQEVSSGAVITSERRAGQTPPKRSETEASGAPTLVPDGAEGESRYSDGSKAPLAQSVTTPQRFGESFPRAVATATSVQYDPRSTEESLGLRGSFATHRRDTDQAQ